MDAEEKSYADAVAIVWKALERHSACLKEMDPGPKEKMVYGGTMALLDVLGELEEVEDCW